MQLKLHLVALLLVACGSSRPTTPAPDLATHAVCPDAPSLCPYQCCGPDCIDTKLDVRNCGACGKTCTDDTICVNGTCGCLPSGIACGMGQSCCGNNGCKSLASDIKNCGACGRSCGDGSTCESGTCLCGGVTCASGQTCCHGSCAATCAATPDMAMPICACPSGCPLSHTCVGQGCCLEQEVAGSCHADPSCIQSNT